MKIVMGLPINMEKVTKKARYYQMPMWEIKYHSYFKDLYVYSKILEKEIERIKIDKTLVWDEKIFIINKKIKPFLYSHSGDISYGYSLLCKCKKC